MILVPLVVVLHTFSPAPLPIPKPYAGPLPVVARPPKGWAVYSLMAGVNHRVAAFGYRGGSLFERREFAMAGALVRHPEGDLLIDTGRNHRTGGTPLDYSSKGRYECGREQ